MVCGARPALHASRFSRARADRVTAVRRAHCRATARCAGIFMGIPLTLPRISSALPVVRSTLPGIGRLQKCHEPDYVRSKCFGCASRTLPSDNALCGHLHGDTADVAPVLVCASCRELCPPPPRTTEHIKKHSQKLTCPASWNEITRYNFSFERPSLAFHLLTPL